VCEIVGHCAGVRRIYRAGVVGVALHSSKLQRLASGLPTNIGEPLSSGVFWMTLVLHFSSNREQVKPIAQGALPAAFPGGIRLPMRHSPTRRHARIRSAGSRGPALRALALRALAGPLLAACAIFYQPSPAALAGDAPPFVARLLAAYPEQLERIDGNTLIWRDGTTMALDDGKGAKTPEQRLDDADIEDMFADAYTAGGPATPPAKDFDPGRARNTAFFDKMYGDCKKDGVEKNLATVVWLAGKGGQRLPFSRVNGADKALAAVSEELNKLPVRFDVYLKPSAGTYNCRVIAGTKRTSAHGYGIAIDIALKHSDYWRNASSGKDGTYAYKNAIPAEVVDAFERHGFIWGGRWYHYDTMHFEYRPELLGDKR
jgi:hypothetical protein